MRKRAIHNPILLFLLFTILAICAAATAGKKEASAAAVPEITAITIMDDAVELQISGDFTYTAYKPSDPFIVTVDLPDVGIGAFGGNIVSDKAGIAEITVSGTRTPMATARLEILMDAPYEIESVKTNNSLVIKIKRAAGWPPQASAMQEEAEAPRQMAVAQASGVVEGAQEPLPPATRITSIDFDYTDGMINLVIKGDGAMSPDVYTLKSRIIVDVPGVAMAAAIPAAVVAPVKAIRYGPYDGKTRLIIDLKEEVQFTASTVADTIVITLPADETLEVMPTEAEVAAEAPEAEAAVPPGEAEPEDEGRKYTGKIISLDFQNANIIPIFRFIGDVSGYNVVIHPSVGGTVTLKLMDVPWDQALDIILTTNRLEQQIEGNIMTIAPTAVFNQIAKERAQREKTEEVVADIVQREIKLRYIEANEMKAKIGEAKVRSARGSIMIDDRRNMLIVRDTANQIKDMRKFIKLWDIPEQRQMQVMIEAKIVEVSTDSDLDLGIKWGGAFAAELGGPDGSMTGSFSVNTPPTGAGAGATVGGGAANFLIGTANTIQVNLSLEALETIGELKKLSNPRILTIEGQSATIQQGVQIPVSTTTAEGSTTEFKNANLSLMVTPTVKPNGIIELQIQANNDTPVSVGGATGINTQSITTSALVKDGETLVIGGIYTTTEEIGEQGVPGLRKIPILGWLFKARSTTVSTKELLILITPTILKAD